MASGVQNFYPAYQSPTQPAQDAGSGSSMPGSFTVVGDRPTPTLRETIPQENKEWIWCPGTTGLRWIRINRSFFGYGDVRVWSSTSEQWHYVTADAITQATLSMQEMDYDTGSNAASESRPSNKNWYDYNRYNPMEKDSDVPSWDGVEIPREKYFRKIQIWEAMTKMPYELRGLKLLARLTGDAAEKLENIQPEQLAHEDSVTRFQQFITEAYEPIEDFRMGKIMDYFLDVFCRKRGQDVGDYNREWARELAKAEKEAGPLQPSWKAHLYLKKMKLDKQQVTQIMVAAQGVYTVEALSMAALKSFPYLKDTHEEPRNDRSGNLHSRNPEMEEPEGWKI